MRAGLECSVQVERSMREAGRSRATYMPDAA
jgi:hypothetical protein